MSRTIIAIAGAVVALGFLVASGIANYFFGASLGRSPSEAMLYGSVGVLAVAMNALAPFFVSWALEASRKTTAISICVLWALCLTYSTTSAFGFAAQNREDVATSKQLSHDAYDDTRRELLDLESRRKDAKGRERARLDTKVDDARKRLATLRSTGPTAADAQSAFLSLLSFGLIEASKARVALVALFALMVEIGATLGLFAALSHSSRPPAPPAERWKPGWRS